MIQPMLAKTAKLPFDNDEWLYEVKYNGVRAVVSYLGENSIRIESRSGKDLTARFPELSSIRLNAKTAILDGEVCVFENGKSVFDGISRRVHLQNSFKTSYMARVKPVTFIGFDLLSLNGEDLTQKTLITRKELLSLTLDQTEIARPSPWIEGCGTRLYAEAVERGLEGIMAKKMSSYYRGVRSDSWLKIKPQKETECVVLGWKNGTSYREKLGALYVAEVIDGEWVYRGKVGSGLDLNDLDILPSTLANIATSLPILPVDEKDVHYVKPHLAVKVAYFDLTNDGKFVFPSFKGVVTREYAKG